MGPWALGSAVGYCYVRLLLLAIKLQEKFQLIRV